MYNALGGNIHQEKIFANFATYSFWRNFYLWIFFPTLMFTQKDMVTFTALAKIYSIEYYKGRWNFCPVKNFGYMVLWIKGTCLYSIRTTNNIHTHAVTITYSSPHQPWYNVTAWLWSTLGGYTCTMCRYWCVYQKKYDTDSYTMKDLVFAQCYTCT